MSLLNPFKRAPRKISRPQRRLGIENLESRDLLCGSCCGAGGAPMADFDALIELITETVAPETRDEGRQEEDQPKQDIPELKITPDSLAEQGGDDLPGDQEEDDSCPHCGCDCGGGFGGGGFGGGGFGGGGFGGGGFGGGGFGGGSSGQGGGSQADFDTLIELITDTIPVGEWDDVPASPDWSQFPNLSLVVSQTPSDAHGQIADLLEQLRKLQDLQVTVEVRFISVTDRFFERIDIDFDFEVDESQSPLQPQDGEPFGGQDGQQGDDQPRPSSDSDQTGLPDFEPTFLGLDTGGSYAIGSAILSDVEVFLFVEAARRTGGAE